MKFRDNRIPQARKMVEAVIGKANQKECKCMITSDNTLVIISLNSLMYAVPLINVQPGFEIAFKYEEIMNLEEDEYIPLSIQELGQIKSYYVLYTNIESNNPLMAYDDDLLSNNEEFVKLMDLKAADGNRIFKLAGTDPSKNYFITVYSSFPSLNKADRIGIRIYLYALTQNINHFANVYTIFKKKINRNYKIYFRTIDLSR